VVVQPGPASSLGQARTQAAIAD